MILMASGKAMQLSDNFNKVAPLMVSCGEVRVLDGRLRITIESLRS